MHNFGNHYLLTSTQKNNLAKSPLYIGAAVVGNDLPAEVRNVDSVKEMSLLLDQNQIQY